MWLVLLAGCATAPPPAPQPGSAEWARLALTLVAAEDFPNADVPNGNPKGLGSVMLKHAVTSDSDVAAFVVRQGIPDAIGSGPQGARHLAYLEEGTIYTLRGAAVEQRPLAAVEQEVLTRQRAYPEQVNTDERIGRMCTRVHAIARRLMRASKPPDQASAAGAWYGFAFRPVRRGQLQYERRSDHTLIIPPAAEWVVHWVDPAGPAAGALQRDDVIVALDGRPVADALAAWQSTDGASRTLSVTRAGQPLTIVVEPERLPYDVQIDVLPLTTFSGEQIANAWASGNRIVFTTAMIDLHDSDDELAWTVGHELAHVVLGHADPKLTVGKAVQNVLDVTAAMVPGPGTLMAAAMRGARGRYNRDQERDADAKGLQYAAAAGYDPGAGAAFLRRVELREQMDLMQHLFDVHPPFPERITQLDLLARQFADRSE